MKKSHVFLAMAGLLTLVGCTKPVMGDRNVATKDEKAIGNSRQTYNDFGSDASVPAASDVPESQTGSAAPAVRETPAVKEISAPAAKETPAPAAKEAPARSGRTSRYTPMETIEGPAGLPDEPVRKGGRKAARKRTAAKTVTAKGGVYVVKAGDYPQKIARLHGVSVTALLEANKMTMADAKKLQIGQKLVIPAKGAKKAGKTQTSAKAQNSAKTEAGIYVVKAGDFPQRIARKLKVKLADLLKANNLTMETSRNLQIGQKLVIPGAKAAAAPQKTAEKTEKTVEQPKEKQEEERPLDDADNVAQKVEQDSPEKTDGDKKQEKTVDENATEPYELPEDTTFKKLAEKFNTTEEHMRRINFDVTGDEALTKGKCILVPAQK